MDNLFYDKEGKPISMREFAILHADMEYRVVKQETIGPYWISTVWLGIDHAFGDSPPIIFETMVFAPDEDALGPDIMGDRYHTEDEAKQGHEEIATLIRATYQPIEEEEEHGQREAPQDPRPQQEQGPP